MVARKEIPIRRPSGRRFVQRGQRLLLSSWPHKNVYCYPQRYYTTAHRCGSRRDFQRLNSLFISTFSILSPFLFHSFSLASTDLFFFYSHSFYSNYPLYFFLSFLDFINPAPWKIKISYIQLISNIFQNENSFLIIDQLRFFGNNKKDG